MPTSTNAVCRGCSELGTACGQCERCQQRAAENSDTHQVSGAEINTIIVDEVHSLPSQSHPSPIAVHSGLPVAGYAKNVDQWKIDMVNENKRLEELVLRRVDEHVRPRGDDSIDGASVQLARRHVEDAFYRLNRAIMQPKRILGDL